jgi:Tfp pilus assembly protein PilX
MIQRTSQKGQALILLVVFAVIAITITSAAIISAINNSSTATKTQEGQIALDSAEAGIDNAMLRLLRNPSYVGETITINGASVVSAVTGSGPKTITSTATYGSYVRSVQVFVSTSSGISTITSWKEL